MNAQRLDDNLVLKGETVHCSRCNATVGSASSWLKHALIAEGPAQALGSLIRAAPDVFVDAPIIYRQAFCPGCLTALLTEVIAQADHRLRTKRLDSAPAQPAL